MSVGANSLLIVPAGFNAASRFAAYSSLGLTHIAGTTLTVPAGQGFAGSGSIGDPVVCQGTITAPSGETINLNAGLVLSGTGLVQLGSGTLTNNDLVSGISGGGLSAACQYVGSGGTGSFTQSGGMNTISNNLYLGYGASDSGTYNLSGSGWSLWASYAYIGYSGTGSFTQSGAINGIGNYLYLGANSGSSGTFSLSGNGQLSAPYEFVGSSGTGSAAQRAAWAASGSLHRLLPSENEWYKAAYYKSGGTHAGYWLYPTQSNTVPTSQSPPGGANSANFYSTTSGYALTGSTNYLSSYDYLTNVGAYSSAMSAYGTFDQCGEVYQWNETDTSSGHDGSWRESRGGSFFGTSYELDSAYRGESGVSSMGFNYVGFRVASVGTVPEPGSNALLLAGGLSLLALVW